MNALKFITTMMILTLWFSSASAQIEIPLDQVSERCKIKVGQFTNNISKIADKRREYSTRESLRKRTLVLFKGKCDYYYSGVDIRHDPVRMETSTLRCRICTPKSIWMSEYLTNLMNLRYSAVRIESTDYTEMRVSNPRVIDRHGTTVELECTVYFEQKFIGYSDQRIVYADNTKKRVKVYITVEQTEDGNEPIVRLGDVYVDETNFPTDI
ncbi:MAG: hypothetical protein II939_14740 [Bacteroidales bacterium]|nr:hypothetical protein [Bacteroidales bacterium]